MWMVPAGLAVVVLLSANPRALATKSMVPPTLQNLSGVWIGGTVGNELEFLRLELDTVGKGVLTVSYVPDSPVRAYYVRSVNLDKFAMKCELVPADSDSEPVFLRGRFSYSQMDLEIGGLSVKWKRQVYLRSQDTFMKRLKQLEDRSKSLP